MYSTACYKNVTDEMVRKAVRADKGAGAKLTSWSIEDFTKKGDNYACVVTSIKGKALVSNKEEDISYILKLNPGMSPFPSEMLAGLFKKEGTFFSEIGPILSEVLESYNQPPLRVPKCYFADYTAQKEILICQDLRNLGFKMADRKKGLDIAHIKLVMKELGRLHSAGLSLQIKDRKVKLSERFPLYNEREYKEKMIEIFKATMANQVEGAVNIMKKIGGFDNIIKHLKENKDDVLKEWQNKYLYSKFPFETIIHADCWVNNMLFRYVN